MRYPTLNPNQVTACSLLAYQCFVKHHREKPDPADSARIQVAEHNCALFNVPFEIQFAIRSGQIKDLPNLNKLSGGNYQNDYQFEPY